MAGTSTTEPVSEQTREGGRGGRRTAGRKRAAPRGDANGTMRFFVARADGKAPVLDREVANEKEALLESLKTGQSYFAVSEWKAIADLSKEVPQIRKEAVRREERDRMPASAAANARSAGPVQAS